MRVKKASLAYLLLVLTCGSGITTGEPNAMEERIGTIFQHQAILDQLGNFVMLWTPLEIDIHIEIQVATKGYIGLGFSPTGGMKGADIVLAWIDDQTGELHIHDRFAQGMFIPEIDDSQDIKVIEGYQNDTHTVLRFSRPWNTCDNEQDFKLSGDTTRIIWAYSEEDPQSEMDMTMHSHRGTKSIYLKEPRFALPEFSEDVKTADFLISNVELPHDHDTFYWCQIYRFPDHNSKHHMIGYVPVIQEGNHEQVHHILLNECHLNDSSFHYEDWLEAGGRPCWIPNMPLSWMFCRYTIIAWAIGSEGEIYPEHVGLPLGEEYGGSNYYLMEIHYDNPYFMKGVIDNSGLRIFYTDKLKEIDAGVMMMGHSVLDTMVIPPRQRWKTTGICSEECITNSIPEDGISVFQGVLHSHLLGRAIKLKQIRNGRELPAVFEDKNYDFNYQQQRVLKEEMIVKPGDTLMVECDYDTTKNRFPTFGGEGTEDEMCLVYLTYYPKMDMSVCLSSPELSNVYQPLGVKEVYRKEKSTNTFRKQKVISAEDIKKRDKQFLMNPDVDYKEINLSLALKKLKVKNPIEKQNRSLYDILHDGETWQDPRSLEELQKRVTYGTHTIHCLNEKGKPIEKVPKTTKYPDHIKIETTADEECKTHPLSEVYKIQEDELMQPMSNEEKHGHHHNYKKTHAAGSSSALRTSFLLVFMCSTYSAFLS